MLPETFPEPDDDPLFLRCVDRMIAGLVARDDPKEVALIRIDNWFDHKWLGFSGIGRVPFHGVRIETALDEFRQDQITFPPFTPNRVVTEHRFGLTTQGDFEEQATAHRVHSLIRDRSSKNLHRRVADFGGPAAFVWFSSRTASNGRGSVMIYSVTPEGVDAWYAELLHGDGWRLGRVKGIAKSRAEPLLMG